MSDEGWVAALGEHAGNPPEPRVVGSPLYTLGDKWTVPPLENRIKAQFEQYVRDRVEEQIQRKERDGEATAAAALRDAYLGGVGAGHYSWDGKHIRSALEDIPGLRHILFLLLRRCHPDVTEAQVKRMIAENPKACGAAVGWAMGNEEEPPAEDELEAMDREYQEKRKAALLRRRSSANSSEQGTASGISRATTTAS